MPPSNFPMLMASSSKKRRRLRIVWSRARRPDSSSAVAAAMRSLCLNNSTTTYFGQENSVSGPRGERLPQSLIRRDQFLKDSVGIDDYPATHASPMLRKIRARLRLHQPESTASASVFASASEKRL